MKKILISIPMLILVACAPMIAPATATPTSTITPSPTTTFTPSPTATVTPTPDPFPANFPDEFKEKLADKQWEIKEDGHIWVTGADGQPHAHYEFYQDLGDWYYSQEYLQDAITAAGITLENSYPENDYAMKFYERQFHGIFPSPDMTRTFTRTDLAGQSYEVECTRIVFYDKNTGEIRIAWAALTTMDNGQKIQLMGNGENIAQNKPYRMKIYVDSVVAQEKYSKGKFPISYYLYNLIFFPLKNNGDFFNLMLKGQSVSWPKDTILPLHFLLTAFYGQP